jgi:hypothetical protein
MVRAFDERTSRVVAGLAGFDYALLFVDDGRDCVVMIAAPRDDARPAAAGHERSRWQPFS